MAESTAEIAKRCVEDATFAKQVLEGEEYPDVRNAIIADLEAEDSVKGYLNPQPMPPLPASRALLISSYAQRAQLYNTWNTLALLNLRALYL